MAPEHMRSGYASLNCMNIRKQLHIHSINLYRSSTVNLSSVLIILIEKVTLKWEYHLKLLSNVCNLLFLLYVCV